jgi:hypothetical protein
MAILPDYTTGTITLTSGSKAFTTSGSALQSKQVRSGDMIYSPATGLFLVIDTVTSENTGTLAYNCPAAAAVTNGPLRVRFQPDVSRYTAALYDVLALLKGGNIDAFAGLTGAADKLAYFTGANTMDVAAFPAFARSLFGLTGAANMLPMFNGADTMVLKALADFMQKSGGTFTGGVNLGTNDGNSAQNGLMLGKRSSGYSEPINAGDGAGGVRGQLGFRVDGAFNVRVGDIVNDDFVVLPGGGAQVRGTDAVVYDICHKGIILGVASQSAGVPTGAIIETGSNANGQYTRFADGTQICWISSIAASFITSSRVAAVWTFPAAFIGTAYSGSTAVLGVNWDGTGATGDAKQAFHQRVDSQTVSSARFNLISAAKFATGDAATLQNVAIGRWF